MYSPKRECRGSSRISCTLSSIQPIILGFIIEREVVVVWIDGKHCQLLFVENVVSGIFMPFAAG